MDAAKKCEDFHLQQGMEQHRTTRRGERIKHCIQDGASDEGNLGSPCSVWRVRNGNFQSWPIQRKDLETMLHCSQLSDGTLAFHLLPQGLPSLDLSFLSFGV